MQAEAEDAAAHEVAGTTSQFRVEMPEDVHARWRDGPRT